MEKFLGEHRHHAFPQIGLALGVLASLRREAPGFCPAGLVRLDQSFTGITGEVGRYAMQEGEIRTGRCVTIDLRSCIGNPQLASPYFQTNKS